MALNADTEPVSAGIVAAGVQGNSTPRPGDLPTKRPLLRRKSTSQLGEVVAAVEAASSLGCSAAFGGCSGCGGCGSPTRLPRGESEDFGAQPVGAALAWAALPPGLEDQKVGATPSEALEVLAMGNARYAMGMGGGMVDEETVVNDDAQGTLAVVVACSDERLHVESIFDVEVGQILVARTCGNVCSVEAQDCVLGSMEFSMVCRAPPLVLVLGHTDCTELEAAVEHVMTARDNSTSPVPDHEDAVVNKLVPAVEDAVRSYPRCGKSEIVLATTELNIWMAIERLLQNSPVTQELVANGKVEVHGALYDVMSKQVNFLGQHPCLTKLGSQGAGKSHLVRSVALPPEEALATMAAGNARYVKGLRSDRLSTSDLRAALAREGQKPTATIIGCADSRVPIEILFDAQPGDLFVLRNAGNTCTHAEGSLVGSVEYSVGHLGTSVIIVMGHTSCGAIVGATKTLLARRAAEGSAEQATRSNLEKLLKGLTTVVEEAEKELHELGKEPSFENLAAQAVRANIFHTMSKLLEYSAEIREHVRLGKVQVHGALYNLTSGEVEFLGQHPDQSELLGLKGEPYDWMKPKVSYFPRPALLNRDGRLSSSEGVFAQSAVIDVIQRLTAGNRRAMTLVRQANLGTRAPAAQQAYMDAPSTAAAKRRPSALVVSSLVMPAERVFDSPLGELLSLRTSYQTIGPANGVVMASIERAVGAHGVPLVLVLGTSRAALIDEALNMVTGNAAPCAHGATPWMQIVSALMPSALSAVRQLERIGYGSTQAGHWAELQALASEMSIFSSVQRILEQSEAIREAVKSGRLEVHGAIFDVRTTRVTFLGPHPRQHELLV